jgi:hypothetical protein
VFVMILLGAGDCKAYVCQWLDVSAYFYRNMAALASRPCKMHIKVKVKLSRYRPGVAQRVGRGIALLFHARSIIRGGEWLAARPKPNLPPGKTRYPLYKRLGGLQSRYGEVRKISPHRDSIPGPSSP